MKNTLKVPAAAMRSKDSFARWMGATGLLGAIGGLYLCLSHHGLG